MASADMRFDHRKREWPDELGFPYDLEPYGNIVKRDASIAQESWQRTKCLTHDHQVEARMKRKQSIHDDLISKVQQKRVKYQKTMEANQACERIVQEYSQGTELADTPLEAFGQRGCTKNLLRGFILVRELDAIALEDGGTG